MFGEAKYYNQGHASKLSGHTAHPFELEHQKSRNGAYDW